MADDPTDPSHREYLENVDPDELVHDDELRLTPQQHERLKDGLHGRRFKTLKRSDRRYLVVGRGGEDGPGERRLEVCERLDDRPGATAFRLEDFGFTGEDIDLWVPAFDILSEMATHIVGILEDFDGGHVWELGFLYHYQTTIRDILWLLKRVYDSEDAMRDHYDNGMAASHLAALEEAAGERVIDWEASADLADAVAEIP
ncbi:aminopeptidase [Haloarchaeobius amylolyticus]|uniref:aminopeptidase n=1 Tax=Haloarchaeobius amylolyticus TaxID=1198296 RepID=UPI00226F5962|nr:aminopeptidase [Haloarchaeobius amylolyticus]